LTTDITMADPNLPEPSLADRDADRALLRSVLQELGNRVRREQLETWFRSLDVRRADEREIEFSVTSQFVKDWLQRNFLGVLQEAVAGLGGRTAAPRRVVLSLRDEDGWDNLPLIEPAPLAAEVERVLRMRDERAAVQGIPASPTLPSAPAGMPAGVARPAPRRGSNPLNPNYTFDKFVVGSCNRLAHASSLAIGENPGCAYNPLFVHGNVGLGKSHLLQAICHTIGRRSQDARVVYLSCEDFTNAYIQAIQQNQLDAFRDYYRHADVLVIDDVQFLANKEKTQDEFFHTFNALYDAQKQIVLSSDRPPVEIPTIEERLVSRFKWGLVAEVEAPCFETRAAIVRRKAMGRGVELPDEVARLLAERVTSNIRELEGAVIKVVGFAGITGQPITLSLAESCVRGMPVHHAQVSSEDVMTLVTTEFAITARELIGKSRTQTVSLPRQVAMFLLREHTENSLEDVGRIFGNRDHTTVLYAVNKIRERSQKDRLFKELLDGLSNRLLTRSFRS
jgi:chromosomal replication initiator protein